MCACVRVCVCVCYTHDVYDFQFIVHLELEGQVVMVVGVNPSPLLHTHTVEGYKWPLLYLSLSLTCRMTVLMSELTAGVRDRAVPWKYHSTIPPFVKMENQSNILTSSSFMTSSAFLRRLL